MFHIFFIHSYVDGYLGCFHVLPSVNGAAMHIEVNVSFELRVFSRYTPKRGIAGLYGSSQFLRNLHTVFRSGFPPIYIPTNSAGGRFPFLHALSSIYCLQTFWWWPFWPAWYITVVSTCIYLIISDVGHLFMYPLATCISSLEKYLFRSSAHLIPI